MSFSIYNLFSDNEVCILKMGFKQEGVEFVGVDYGLASRYGNVVEINKKLDNFPKLKQKIIDHELGHTKNKSYGIKDFKNDFMSKDSTFWQQIKFCLDNKESFINYMPFMYSYYFKEWTFSLTSLFPLISYGILFIAFFALLTPLPFLHLIFGWLGVIFGLNLISLAVTHNYIRKLRKKDVESE